MVYAICAAAFIRILVYMYSTARYRRSYTSFKSPKGKNWTHKDFVLQCYITRYLLKSERARGQKVTVEHEKMMIVKIVMPIFS